MKAAKFLSKPYLLVLFIVTFIDATIHNGYFLMAGSFLGSNVVGIKPEWIMPVMSIGQIAEIATMAVLGWFLSRMGWKTTMILGVLGHAARFAVFAFMPQNQTMIILVQVLHGVCYAFFFATLYIFIDAAFPKDVRSSAQSLFNLLVLGLGDLAAKWLFIPLQDSLKTDAGIDYQKLFLVPTLMAVVAAGLLLLAFWPPRRFDDAAGWAFAGWWLKAGFWTRVGTPRGDDIDAACGQLAGDILDRTDVQRRVARQRTIELVRTPHI